MRKALFPVALLVIAAVVLFLTRDSEPQRAPNPKASAGTGEPTELVYLEGLRLYIYDLETGEVSPGPSLPSADVDVTLDGRTWAATSGVPAQRDPDPETAPAEIIVGAVDDDSERKSIGIGYSPVWSPDDDEIAAVFPVEGYLICGLDVDPELAQSDPTRAGCKQGERVAIYQSDGGEPDAAIGAGGWRILGWVASDSVVGASIERGQVKVGYAGASDEDQIVVPVRAREVLAMSPNEARFLITTGSGASITDDEANTVVAVASEPLVSAAWAPDGSHIAGSTSGTVLIDVATGTVDVVSDIKPTSEIIWSPDSSHIAFSSRQGAVVCSISESRCDTYRLGSGVRLAALR